MARPTRVLVTDITSYKAAVVARFLERHYPALSVSATDHRKSARWLSSRFARRTHILPCDPESGRAYVEALATVLEETGAELLIPVNSKEIRVLLEHRELLGSSYAYTGNAALYATLDDKGQFGRLIEQLGLPQPHAHASLDAAPPPLVLKPVRGSAAKGMYYLFDAPAIAVVRAKLGNTPDGYIIQEYVAGEGVGYSGYFEHGRIVVGYAHRRVAEWPVSGGSSVVRETYPYEDADELRALVGRVLAAAPWSGFAMFELKRRSPGGFMFIECNPRIWGSIHQGLASGVNYFESLLGPATGLVPNPRVRTELVPLSWLSLAGYLRGGRFDVVRDVASGWSRTALDINPLSDPLGFAALLARGA